MSRAQAQQSSNFTEAEQLTMLLIKESRECQSRAERILELEGQVSTLNDRLRDDLAIQRSTEISFIRQKLDEKEEQCRKLWAELHQERSRSSKLAMCLERSEATLQELQTARALADSALPQQKIATNNLDQSAAALHKTASVSRTRPPALWPASGLLHEQRAMLLYDADDQRRDLLLERDALAAALTAARAQATAREAELQRRDDARQAKHREDVAALQAALDREMAAATAAAFERDLARAALQQVETACRSAAPVGGIGGEAARRIAAAEAAVAAAIAERETACSEATELRRRLEANSAAPAATRLAAAVDRGSNGGGGGGGGSAGGVAGGSGWPIRLETSEPARSRASAVLQRTPRDPAAAETTTAKSFAAAAAANNLAAGWKRRALHAEAMAAAAAKPAPGLS